MAKKNRPKEEKAKRNQAYARLHKKKARPFARRSRGPSRPTESSAAPAGGEGGNA